jgi:flagellar export protein FliJ
LPIKKAMSGSSYRFRLERIRALRERREEEAKMELAGALMRRQQCREELTRAEARIADARRAQLDAACAELRDHQAYLERMEQARRLTLDELARHEQDVAGRRARLVTASQEREALEKLKEKGLDAHNREQARVEQITLDEIAGNGYWRRAA